MRTDAHLQEESQDSLERIREPELVEMARSGDREAFGELVRRHRGKALGWATSIEHDVFMAEDIVQDALIRAFLHMATLRDSDRFIPWLKQIVRNQTNARIRSLERHGRERTFTQVTGSTTSAAWESVDWKDIDSILFHLSCAVSQFSREQDPSVQLMRKETVDGIRVLLRCLSARERDIFEAYFFRQLQPDEIASLFNTSTANVYNFLSRSRRKVQSERIRVYFQDYAKRRTEAGLSKKKILTRPFG